MEIDFDPVKDAINLVKHGLSLADAGEIDFAQAVVRSDHRGNYGEQRELAYATISGRLHVLAYTWRDGRVRAISLRRANSREVASYGRQG